MAYMNQERKAIIAAELKKVVPAGWKYSLSVNNYSTIVFTLSQAPVDILGNIATTQDDYGVPNKVDRIKGYWQVNEYHLERQFSGAVLEVFEKIKAALNFGNWDKSDIMTDYFNVGWYVSINVGKWNSPFLDTVPADQVVKVPKSVLNLGKTKVKAKIKFSMKQLDSLMAQGVIPYDYESLTPGRKAAATKKARQYLGVVG